jgi:hypothetical protein
MPYDGSSIEDGHFSMMVLLDDGLLLAASTAGAFLGYPHAAGDLATSAIQK